MEQVWYEVEQCRYAKEEQQQVQEPKPHGMDYMSLASLGARFW